MSTRWLTRRDLLRRAGIPAAGALVGLGFAEQALTASDDDLAVGTLISVDNARHATVLLDRQGPMAIALTPDAFVAQGYTGAVPDLGSFVAGERVVVRGKSMTNSFSAYEFQSLFLGMRGEVLGDPASETLVTSTGQLRVPTELRQRSGIRLARGSRYSAQVWIDPLSGDRIAAVLRIE